MGNIIRQFVRKEKNKYYLIQVKNQKDKKGQPCEAETPFQITKEEYEQLSRLFIEQPGVRASDMRPKRKDTSTPLWDYMTQNDAFKTL